MKTLCVILLLVGTVLLLAIESKTAVPNIIGLVLVTLAFYKLKLLTL